MFEPNTHRYTNCEWCGKRFVDDCGDSFCSSSCENQYEEEHARCERCNSEVGATNLNSDYLCEDCEEEDDE